MFDDMYFRGSGLYEVAVKNKLDELEQAGVRNATAMLNGIREIDKNMRLDIRKSTYAIVASQEILANISEWGFNSLKNTINFGFDSISQDMNKIADSITLMSDSICNKLDEIHDIVNNPRLTAARELYRRATINFEKGYFEEALEDCLQAVEKERTDFFTWFLLGNIYLYGAGKYSNTINLLKAEDAFTKAARYIDSDIDTSNEVNDLASLIYYEIGHTKLNLSNDLLVSNKNEESRTKLEEAGKAFEESVKFDGNNLKAVYESTKVIHFLGNDDEVLKRVSELIEYDINFALLFATDKNFESVSDQIEQLINEKKIKEINALKLRIEEKINHYIENTTDKYADEFNKLKIRIAEELAEFEKKDYFTVCKKKYQLEQKFVDYAKEIYHRHENFLEEQRQEQQVQVQKKEEEVLNLELIHNWEYFFQILSLALKNDAAKKLYFKSFKKLLNEIGKEEFIRNICFRSISWFKNDEKISIYIYAPYENNERYQYFSCGNIGPKIEKHVYDKNEWTVGANNIVYVPSHILNSIKGLRYSKAPFPDFKLEEDYNSDLKYTSYDISGVSKENLSLQDIISKLEPVAKSLGYYNFSETIRVYNEELDKYLDRILNYKAEKVSWFTHVSENLKDFRESILSIYHSIKILMKK